MGDKKPTASETGTKAGPLLLTNAPNLSHFLSLGYVGPAESFGAEDNYYGDLLEAAPGRLPLLAAPLSSDLIEHVRRESPRSARPVLLEFVPEALPQEDVPSLDIGGNPVVGPAADPDSIATAPALVLPFSAVRRVIFLSEEDRDEVLARSFVNVPSIPFEQVAVIPRLMGDGAVSLEAVQSWLSDLEHPQNVTREGFGKADRVAGAVALAVHSRPDLKENLLALLQSKSTGPELPSWFGILTSDLPASVPPDPDALTFAAAVSVLRSSSPNAWRPREVLEEVWERIIAGGLSEEEVNQLDKSVDRIRRILNNDDEFKHSGSQRYPALQGLMLLLIREKPTELLAWDPEETQAGAWAHLTAVLYAGLLHGRARLPQTLRDQDADRQIAEIVARRLSALPLPQRQLTTQIREPGPKHQHPVERDLVSVLLEADLKADGPYRRAAIDLCGYMDWKDCVTFHVTFPDADEDSAAMKFISTTSSKYNKKRLDTWRARGVVELRYELDAECFRTLLKAGQIPDKHLNRVQTELKKEIGSL